MFGLTLVLTAVSGYLSFLSYYFLSQILVLKLKITCNLGLCLRLAWYLFQEKVLTLVFIVLLDESWTHVIIILCVAVAYALNCVWLVYKRRRYCLRVSLMSSYCWRCCCTVCGVCRSSEAGAQSWRNADQDRSLGFHLHLHRHRLPTTRRLDDRSNYSLARTRTYTHHRHQRKVDRSLLVLDFLMFIPINNMKSTTTHQSLPWVGVCCAMLAA